MSETALLTILTLVCALTYSFEITFGLAGTILMLPILSFFFPAKTLVIYSLLPQIIVSAIAISRSYKKVHLKTLGTMTIFAAAGVVIGSLLFKGISTDTLQLLLAIIITLTGLFLIIAPSFKIKKQALFFVDMGGGFSHALFGISGPIVMTRLLGTFKDKTRIRNNALAFYLGINLIRGVNYLINNSITPQIFKMFYSSAPFLIIILFFADKLHFKINDQIFKKAAAWIILGSGLVLIIKTI